MITSRLMARYVPLARFHGSRFGISMVGSAAIIGTVAGCATTPRLPVEATAYRIEVNLDPATHRIIGETTMNLVRTDSERLEADVPVAVELLLHPDLRITHVSAAGLEVEHRRAGPTGDHRMAGGFAPRSHLVVMTDPPDALTITVGYEGKLFQDVAAGEKQGEIHNVSMRAHIGEDGVYLGGGYWYPDLLLGEDAVPRLADYTVLADPIDGMELVAGAQRDLQEAEVTGQHVWRSPYPLDGMVIAGGAHDVHEQEHNGTTIRLHLRPSQAAHADGLFDAVKRYLDRYEPLIGKYPAKEFTIVDNFFSSGFAFPTFTLLSSAVIGMGERSQTAHGYIDHEVLHCWWGNGIHVDPEDGNWCEAIASYGANYYGHILDGSESEARRKRRNYAHFLSRLKPEKDKPLGTFSRKDGCGRGIAYNKGAAVFHMLARKMGQDNFWSAMGRLTREFVGRYASWEDIRTVCEQESGQELDMFFRQWIRSGGAPELTIESARYDASTQTLTVAISQDEPAFDLDVPIRVTHASGSTDMEVTLNAPSDEFAIPVEFIPRTVEVDPDYHIFRRVPANDIIPTTATTRSGDTLATILPPGDVHEQYTELRTIFESSFEKKEQKAEAPDKVDEDVLRSNSILILGNGVRDPVVAKFLEDIGLTVRWGDNGFEFDGTRYTDPGDAILCSMVHPDQDPGGITILFANSDEAIPKAFTVPFYDRSLVIFKDGKAMHRHDFEPRHAVAVEP